jgi:hypothetical protein
MNAVDPTPAAVTRRRRCPNCLHLFDPNPKTPWQKFCSTPCRLEFHRTGEISLEKFRHYIQTYYQKHLREIIVSIARIDASLIQLSQRIDRIEARRRRALDDRI